MQFDLVGLGVSTIDLIQVVDVLPGTEMVQKAHDCVISGGGPVATAIVAAARLGAATAMIDRIGDDLFGRMIMEEYRAAGVETAGMIVEEGRTSSKASILVRKGDGARAIIYSPGDAGDFPPARVCAETIRSARMLHLNGRHFEACLHAARLARRAGVSVSFDGGAHRYQPEHRDLIPLVDICIIAEEYASSCTGKAESEAAADAMLQMGPRLVVVTRGRGGSLICQREGERFHQKAFEVDEVVDTTGAGDAYHGAFLFGLARGCTLKEAAALASAAGALNTRSLGGRCALPTLPELQRFLQDN